MTGAHGAQRFTLIDGLRGIAAMAVVLFHMRMGGFLDSMPLLAGALTHGSLGVAVFFALSGFVIAHSLYGKTVTAGFAGRFMLRRSIRLDPAYWVAIVMSIAALYAFSLFGDDQAAPRFTVGQIVAHLFYAQDLLGFPEINAVFWTLCLEVQFYLIYIVLLMLGRHRAALACACVVSLPWAFGLLTVPHGLFLPLWHGFLVGVAAYWAWKDRLTEPYALAFVAAVFVAGIVRGDPFPSVCAATAVVLWAGARFGFMGALNWRWLQYLGAISYSLYLTHFYIGAAVMRVGARLTDGRWEALWAAASLAACVVVAHIVWRCVEVPSISLAARFKR